MAERRWGRVINVSSVSARQPSLGQPAYAASKAGLIAFTQAVAQEFGPSSVTANAILPGWIDTEFTRTARQQVAGLNERVLARTPAGRWGSPEDFAGIAVFLASAASDFISGAAIPVDGGFSAQG